MSKGSFTVHQVGITNAASNRLNISLLLLAGFPPISVGGFSKASGHFSGRDNIYMKPYRTHVHLAESIFKDDRKNGSLQGLFWSACSYLPQRFSDIH
jgi:hypothetical protein